MVKLSVINEKTPLQCGIILQEHRKSGAPLTPEFCREILTLTANQGIASKLLDKIEQHLEQAPAELDLYLPYMETMVERLTATPKVVEKAARIADKYFPNDNCSVAEYAFANRLSSAVAHSEISAQIAAKMLKRAKNNFNGDTSAIYDPDNLRFNLQTGYYAVYPEKLAADLTRMLKEKSPSPCLENETKLYLPADANRAELLKDMAALFEPCAAEIWQKDPSSMFLALAALSQTAAKNLPANEQEQEFCVGCFKRTLKALRDIPPLTPEMLDTSLEIVPLLLSAVGRRSAAQEFPRGAVEEKSALERNLEPIAKFHWVEAFLPKLLEHKIDVKKMLEPKNYRGTPQLLNISLNELATRANSVAEAKYLLHNCFAFNIISPTCIRWLRYPETSGAMLNEDYKNVLHEGGYNLSEISHAVNRGAEANFRLINKANREPDAGASYADLRDNSLEALLNVYCEAYRQQQEPPHEIYKTLYKVRFGKTGRLAADRTKPQEIFHTAVKGLKYEEIPPELLRLAQPSYGFSRLFLKKGIAR